MTRTDLLEAETLPAPEVLELPVPPDILTLDFSLGPDDAASLPRARAIAALKAGRVRSSALSVVWHDTADAALAGAGLSLAQAGGLWRLEQLQPDAGLWPPATPAPLIAEGADPAAFGPPLASPVIPWAAFEGRSASIPLRVGEDEITLTLLDGGVRSVTTERRISRIRLEGPERSVLDLALALAAETSLSVPRATLAAEALACARSTVPAPRRLGAPALPPELTVAEALGMVVAHLTDVILHWAPLAAAGRSGPEPVHQMRVAVRRLRSALTLFRRAGASSLMDEARAGLRALGAVLGPARDWDVFVAGTGRAVGAAFPEERAVLRLLNAAERQRLSGYADLQAHLSGAPFRRLGVLLAALAATRFWQEDAAEDQRTLLDEKLPDFAARVLDRRLRGMRDAAGEAIEELPEETLHAVRLDGKRLRYACEFFLPVFPGRASRRFVRRLTVLQERMGVLNDGVVARSLMERLGGPVGERALAVGIVLGYVAAHKRDARAGIIRAWERFVRQEPFWS